ncbi:MAG: hypothetical protein ACREXM_19680 [Gammaproteobacteria bacterium]
MNNSNDALRSSPHPTRLLNSWASQREATLITLPRLKAVWPWLAEARYAWLSVAVIVIALVVSLRPHTAEPVIRLTGLVLQLMGIATVIWGISETRALFGHPSLTSKAKSWLARFPLLRRNVVIGVGGAALSAAVGKARGYGTHGPGPNPTIQTRLDALEKNVIAIHERITQTQAEMDEGFYKSADALKREEQSRLAEDTAIREKLEATGTGGVHISAIGASWLFVGVILSTASVEIAAFIK